jgi:phosphoenolpyruvate synthase/pyruvate phosphate dikinase
MTASIGSNDLTQLVLGLDRDSELVAPLIDERNPAVLALSASSRRRGPAAEAATWSSKPRSAIPSPRERKPSAPTR